MKRTHARIVTECYLKLKNSEHPEKVFARYGRKTGEEALQMYNEEQAKKMGMTMEQFNEWLWSED